MYTQIETVVIYEEGDLVECVYDEHLDEIRCGDVLKIDVVENKDKQWLGFKLKKDWGLTYIEADCFKPAKELVKVEEFDNETKRLGCDLK